MPSWTPAASGELYHRIPRPPHYRCLSHCTNPFLVSLTARWDRSRHLVPMLDLINCAEGPNPKRVHSTVMDSAVSIPGVVAFTV